MPFIELNTETGLPGYYVECRVNCIPYDIGSNIPVEIGLDDALAPMELPTPPKQTTPVP
jgi:hypothetical protein